MYLWVWVRASFLGVLVPGWGSGLGFGLGFRVRGTGQVSVQGLHDFLDQGFRVRVRGQC